VRDLRRILFFGGEPLIGFDTIKEAVELLLLSYRENAAKDAPGNAIWEKLTVNVPAPESTDVRIIAHLFCALSHRAITNLEESPWAASKSSLLYLTVMVTSLDKRPLKEECL
jgi:hypothetical protein